MYGIFVQYQVEALQRIGHKPEVISPHPYIPPFPGISEKYKSLHKDVPYKSQKNGITVRYPRTISLPNERTQALTAIISRVLSSKWISALENDGFTPDLINAHVANPNGYASIPISKHFDVPLITTIHGADLNLLYRQYFNRYIINKCLSESDAVLVNSQKIKQQIPDRIARKTDIHVVANGIPVSKIDEVKSRDIPAEIKQDKLTIISVGDLIRSKDQLTVLKALSQLDIDYQYILIGDGPYRQTLEEYVEEMDMEDVLFLGEILNEKVFEYLWNSQIFVLPSYREAFGIAYLEAMACEVPVIACRGEGPEEYITHRQNGYLIDKQDHKQLRYYLLKLSRNESLRDDLGTSGRNVAEKYSWEANVQEIERIYQSLISDQ
ncbi:glycosyltransferase [Halorubrum halophilum]|uniref:glycosyltransferase n=1 Tax=Halorubrum halophilum TaxID=413816 RepID=UPI001376BBF2|nr:glycosyltransferase [Halorubrum halophilum]